MFKQISEYFEPILSKFQCGFRKRFGAQHCLLAMLEKWKSAVDKNRNFGAFLNDLSKAFDYLSHDLLLAKLKCLWIQFTGTNYLSNRKKQTKINSKFSPW